MTLSNPVRVINLNSHRVIASVATHLTIQNVSQRIDSTMARKLAHSSRTSN